MHDDADMEARHRALQSILGGSKAAMLGKKLPPDRHPGLVLEIILGQGKGEPKSATEMAFQGEDDDSWDKNVAVDVEGKEKEDRFRKVPR